MKSRTHPRRIAPRAALIAALVGMAAAVSAAPALAQQQDSLGADWRQQQDEARRAVREGRHVPLSRVIDEIRRQTPGRQLDAGIETDPSGATVYRVRWAAVDGRRIDYIVDAQTGRILRKEGR
jgi:uncharacterized membrane protein YkoI